MLTNWITRNTIVFKQVCGENDAIDVQNPSVWSNISSKVIENYSPDDIFYVDEIGLTFKRLPEKLRKLRRDLLKFGFLENRIENNVLKKLND